MCLRYIVGLLICVAKFNAQNLVGDLVGVVGDVVDGVGNVVEDLLPVPTKSYISRGYDAYEGQFPYQAILKTVNGQFFCGASVIGQRWVLTAGHCFYNSPRNNPNAVTVGVGSIDRNAGDTYYVSLILIHPNYRGPRVSFYQYDAAVVQTSIYMQLSNLVRPIVLGVAGVSTGRECFVSGWGRTGAGNAPGSQFLQYAPQRTISFNQCQRAWPMATSASDICTERVGDSGPRSGDSGGPLALTIAAGYRQIGIVSGSAPGKPYVYTRVSYIYNWVRQACNFEIA
ncbi:trypsin-1-like [Bradysia coprophila]|uniref:trypsin-1-like n=1 Tax=Bradysia coprophila TaxID=38358 RepID=UPI00187DBFF9|nr:trypsin-1-like [Bradysia coprophila]